MLVVVNLNETVSLPAVESLLSNVAVKVTPASAPLSVYVSSKAIPLVDALIMNSPVLSRVPLVILYLIDIPLLVSAGNSFIVVADDVLSGKVCDLINLVVTPIPCTSGAAFVLPSDLLASVLSKKSWTDEHSSLSN